MGTSKAGTATSSIRVWMLLAAVALGSAAVLHNVLRPLPPARALTAEPAAVRIDSGQSSAVELAAVSADPITKNPDAALDPTGEEVLSQFWGHDWPAVRAKLVETGFDPNARYRVLPWDVARIRIHDEILGSLSPHLVGIRDSFQNWPAGGPDGLWLQQQFGLGHVPSVLEVAEVVAICTEANLQMADLIGIYVADLEVAVRQALDQGGYARQPIVTVPDPGAASAEVFSGASAFGGWAVSLSLSAVSHPQLAEQQRAIRKAKAGRNALVRQYFRGR